MDRQTVVLKNGGSAGGAGGGGGHFMELIWGRCCDLHKAVQRVFVLVVVFNIKCGCDTRYGFCRGCDVFLCF